MASSLPRSFYSRPTLAVARELLGCVLSRRVGRQILRGRIVETEAYVGEEDLACHARAGITPRTEPLYGPPGFAYVYLTYGMHHLLNAVTEARGKPAAVLIRAAEPLVGIEWMEQARGLTERHLLASGPARLCRAFGLDLAWNRTDLRGGDLWIERGDSVAESHVAASPRIGCQNVPGPWDAIPWRFYVAGSPHVTPGRRPRKLLMTSAPEIGNNRASRNAPSGRIRTAPSRR